MKGTNKAYFDKHIDPYTNEIDRVNIYEFENGMDFELTAMGGELTRENIRKAQSKVLKNLRKDAAYYTNAVAEATTRKFSVKKPKKEKEAPAEAKVPTEKIEEKDKANEMKPLKENQSLENEWKEKKASFIQSLKNQTGKPKKEGYQGTDYDISEDMVKTGAGLPGSLPERKFKINKKELAEMIGQVMREAKAFRIKTSSGDEITKSFADSTEANKFKQNNSNITSVEEL